MATLMIFSPISSLQTKTLNTTKHKLQITHKTLTHVPNPPKFQSITFLTKPSKTIIIKSKISEILGTTPNTPQTLKSRLKNKETLYGLFLMSNSPTLAEIAGLSGYDYVIVDLELGPGGISGALECLRALSAARTPGIIRLPHLEPTWISKSLDIGPQGIMFPRIESQKMAKKAVSYCRYPPNGIRGGSHRSVRASSYGIDYGYVSNINDELFIICQVETEEGVNNVEEIAAVNGVDCVHLGPSDLSKSMGYLGDSGNKKVQEMIRTVEKGVLKTTGKDKDGGGGAYLGGVATSFDRPEVMMARGYHMITGGTDIGTFRDGCVEKVKRFKLKVDTSTTCNSFNSF